MTGLIPLAQSGACSCAEWHIPRRESNLDGQEDRSCLSLSLPAWNIGLANSRKVFSPLPYRLCSFEVVSSESPFQTLQ